MPRLKPPSIKQRIIAVLSCSNVNSLRDLLKRPPQGSRKSVVRYLVLQWIANFGKKCHFQKLREAGFSLTCDQFLSSVLSWMIRQRPSTKLGRFFRDFYDDYAAHETRRTLQPLTLVAGAVLHQQSSSDRHIAFQWLLIAGFANLRVNEDLVDSNALRMTALTGLPRAQKLFDIFLLEGRVSVDDYAETLELLGSACALRGEIELSRYIWMRSVLVRRQFHTLRPSWTSTLEAFEDEAIFTTVEDVESLETKSFLTQALLIFERNGCVFCMPSYTWAKLALRAMKLLSESMHPFGSYLISRLKLVTRLLDFQIKQFEQNRGIIKSSGLNRYDIKKNLVKNYLDTHLVATKALVLVAVLNSWPE